MDVHWNEKHFVDEKDRAPEWLYLKPSVYLQQVIVRGIVEPWNAFNLTSQMAVKGPLSRAFHILKILYDLRLPSGEVVRELHSQCFHIQAHLLRPGAPKGLPSHGCLILSPALFWYNDELQFFQDGDILKTIFSPSCTPSMCPREMFLGMPTRMTGIKKSYQTNRHRSIDYGITLFLSQYDPEFILAFRSSLAKRFEVQKSQAADDSTFVHVFYRPRKYFTDFFPLISTYLLLMLYIYFSVSKIVMVKSKWGLALAAVVTMAAALAMTAGICAYLEMMPTFWGAELFPYLALIVGLENTLCLTRSVVYTPPNMDVRSRLSHGLSQEGYSFTKYFLLELTFLTVGYITLVPEIQEFCTFAFIGLFVDFYMQLFFYVPCLTFDLRRLGNEDKQRFSLMLFNSDIRQYKKYPKLTCPMMRIWPRLFVDNVRLFRVKSDSQIRDDKEDKDYVQKLRGHRRTTSAVSINHANDLKMSIRFRLLYYWTKTRFLQRAIMALFVVWTMWIAFIVHKWRIASTFSTGNVPSSISDGKASLTPTLDSGERFGISHRVLESAPLQWGEWQRRTFNWWPILFGEYNLSLSGHYITFLPPIVLKAVVPPNDVSIVSSGSADETKEKFAGGSSPSNAESELSSRIYNLETQMTAILVISGVFLFSTVTLFILYVCFSGRSHSRRVSVSQQPGNAAASESHKVRKRIGSKSFVESVPLVFSGHSFSIECIGIINPSTIISSCLEGKVIVWDASTGEKKSIIDRKTWFSVYAHSTEVATSSGYEPRRLDALRNRAVSTLNGVRSTGNGFSRTSVGSNDVFDREIHPPQIWCMAVKQKIIVLGCADGSVEIACSETSSVISVLKGSHSNAGVVHLQIRGGRIALVRLDGTLEFLDIRFSAEHPITVQHVQSVWCGRAHQMAITRLEVAPLSVITASHDHTLKVYDIRSSRLLFTLQGHNAPVLSVCVDRRTNILYSSCEAGVICAWDLEDGQLIRTVEDVFLTNESVELACTTSMLLGYSSDRHLWIWDKRTGQLYTRITPDTDSNTNKEMCCEERKCLIAMSDKLAATSCDVSVQFWDLDYKVMIKQVQINGSIDQLLALDERSVVCCSANHMYRINVPVIKLE